MKRRNGKNRIFEIILVTGLCLSMLTGCSAGKASVEKKDSSDGRKQNSETEKRGKKEGKNESVQQVDFVTGIKQKYADNEKNEYDEAMYNLEKDHVFVFENLPDRFFDNEEYECFKVFYDAELQNFVDITVQSDYDKKTVTISPNLTFSYHDAQGSTADDGTWGTRSKFFLVRYVNLDTGEMLDKPVITVFTIKQEMDTPTLEQSVDEQGYYQLTWSAVEEADYYEVYGLDKGMDFAELQYTAEKGVTKCNYEDFKNAKDYEQHFREKYGNTEINVDEKWLMNEMLNASEYSYFVVARTNDGRVSGMSNECLVAKIANQIPRRKSDEFQSDYEGETILALPAYVDVEMLDGSIGRYLIEYNGAQVYLLEDGSISVWPSIKNLPIGMLSVTLKGVEYEAFMSTTDLLKEREEKLEDKSGIVNENIVIPYVPKNDEKIKENGQEGTSERETVTSDAADGDKADEDKADEDKADEDKTDEEETNKGGADAEYDAVSEELADTIYANSAMAEWTAYNLLAHNEVISYREFPESSNTEFLRDVFLEAYNQNPLCGIIDELWYDYETDAIYIRYVLTSEETKQMQDECLKTAKEVTDKIIKEHMSDYEKVQEINRFICENAVYNEKIFDYIGEDGTVDHQAVVDYAGSFTPYGVLVDHIGVCESYSEAFLLLSHFAGLETVIETGTMSGVSHEWNRVRLDGQWYTIDVTNNDADDIPNCYFNIPDELAETIYHEDQQAFMDDYLSEYSAQGMDNEYYTRNDLYADDKEDAVALLAELLESNDIATVRVSSDTKEKDIEKIVKKAAKTVKMTSGMYYYRAGVISVVK